MASNDSNSNGTVHTATHATPSSCPVLGRRGDAEPPAKTGLWSRWFSRSNLASTTPHIPVSSPAVPVISECPARGNEPIPASIEAAANYSQTPSLGQKTPLSTQRVISSIPRADGEDIDNSPSIKPPFPAHQPVDSPRWQYPSEQQFYNAMIKKGYNPPVEAIPDTLRIHNAVNERSWLQVCKWERELHNNPEPKLAKFVGRPKDVSPRAWWNSHVLMTQEPFDRHDWYVEDVGGGEPRRYVIDFYEGKESSALLPSSAEKYANGEGTFSTRAKNMPSMKPPSMYIDVRPALDNPSAAVDRMTMFMREALPGLAALWDSYKA